MRKRKSMKLKEGVYENLISSRLTADMKETEAEGGGL